MNSSREIFRSVAVLVASFAAMLIAIVVLGLHVERSVGKAPSVFPVSISWKEKSPRSALSWAYRVGS